MPHELTNILHAILQVSPPTVFADLLLKAETLKEQGKSLKDEALSDEERSALALGKKFVSELYIIYKAAYDEVKAKVRSVEAGTEEIYSLAADRVRENLFIATAELKIPRQTLFDVSQLFAQINVFATPLFIDEMILSEQQRLGHNLSKGDERIVKFFVDYGISCAQSQLMRVMQQGQIRRFLIHYLEQPELVEAVTICLNGRERSSPAQLTLEGDEVAPVYLALIKAHPAAAAQLQEDFCWLDYSGQAHPAIIAMRILCETLEQTTQITTAILQQWETFLAGAEFGFLAALGQEYRVMVLKKWLRTHHSLDDRQDVLLPSIIEKMKRDAAEFYKQHQRNSSSVESVLLTFSKLPIAVTIADSENIIRGAGCGIVAGLDASVTNYLIETELAEPVAASHNVRLVAAPGYVVAELSLRQHHLQAEMDVIKRDCERTHQSGTNGQQLQNALQDKQRQLNHVQHSICHIKKLPSITHQAHITFNGVVFAGKPGAVKLVTLPVLPKQFFSLGNEIGVGYQDIVREYRQQFSRENRGSVSSLLACVNSSHAFTLGVLIDYALTGKGSWKNKRAGSKRTSLKVYLTQAIVVLVDSCRGEIFAHNPSAGKELAVSMKIDPQFFKKMVKQLIRQKLGITQETAEQYSRLAKFIDTACEEAFRLFTKNTTQSKYKARDIIDGLLNLRLAVQLSARPNKTEDRVATLIATHKASDAQLMAAIDVARKELRHLPGLTYTHCLMTGASLNLFRAICTSQERWYHGRIIKPSAPISAKRLGFVSG